jgi:hypothetical protein
MFKMRTKRLWGYFALASMLARYLWHSEMEMLLQ